VISVIAVEIRYERSRVANRDHDRAKLRRSLVAGVRQPGRRPNASDQRPAQVRAIVITICDTGPLVAYLNRNDRYHSWAVAVMKQVRSPMLTTEPVLTEAAYFLRTDRIDVDPLFQLLERDAVKLDLPVAAHWPRLRTLMARYEQMDLADASIVVLSERHPRSQVVTVDRRDFSIYRRNDRQVIDFIAPPKE